MSTVQYVKEAANKVRRKDYFLFKKVIVLVQDSLPQEINLSAVLKQIESTIPEKFVYELDSIYIGDFKELNSRQIESLYIDGAILVTNQQDSEESLVKTLIHEIGHNVEKVYTAELYSDGLLQKEFLNKRQRVYTALDAEGYEVELSDFMKIDYTKEFDELMYDTVGYDKLAILSSGIFVGPYSITSLREYFASCFEHYFTGDSAYIKQLSPKAFLKITQLGRK